MKDTVFEPIRLQVYICGNGNDPEMSGLRHDLLTQNICIAAPISPKRVEEIAARLGTAAAFIESRLPALVPGGLSAKRGRQIPHDLFHRRRAVYHQVESV